MEGDDDAFLKETFYNDFNPLPPHGGRRRSVKLQSLCKYFNPLPPHGGRPSPLQKIFALAVFQSTPSAWRETLTCYHNCVIIYRISIHSLRMEGDSSIISEIETPFISIHSLRMEGDHSPGAAHMGRCYFNPLPPHGGRRFHRSTNANKPGNFNPLPPHGGRPGRDRV